MTTSARITIAGAVATFLASLSLLPAHDSGSWVWMGMAAIVLVALLGYGLRQLRVPRLLIPFGQLAGLLWAFLLFAARDDLHYGFIPSRDALESLALQLGAGMTVVVRYSAPLPYNSDALLLTALGIGLVAFAVDSLAATARLVPWAGLPLLLLYSIPATTVAGGLSALAFVPTAIGYTALLMVESRGRINQWGRALGVSDRFTSHSEGIATSTFGKTGRRVGAAAICIAVVVPIFVPAMPPDFLASGQGTGFGTGGGGQTIRIDNPIVNLRRDLRRPDNFRLMTYRTNAEDPEYLRLAVLDEYDGEQWRPTSRDVPRDQQVAGEVPRPPGLSDEVGRKETRSGISIDEALRSKRLPLPYPYVAVDVEGDWRYDRDTLDVVVGPDEDADATAGLEYTVTGLALDLDPEQLRETPAPPQDVTERYTRLPADVPEPVLELADDIVGDADTPYDMAVALQDYFRSEFIYSTTPEPGHGGSQLLEFLQDKRGYCEQFAASMAIMARSLGIPARVAVGYMPGSNVGDNTWEVKVHDAHAWPELYFEGFGWIRFEPTPSQQTGSPPSWTESAQAPAPAPSPTTETSRPNQPSNDPQQQPGNPNFRPELDPNNPSAGMGGEVEEPFNPVPFLIAGGVLLVLALPALIRPVVRRVRFGKRGGPAKRVEAVWRELGDTARDLGLKWDETTTPRLAADTLRRRLPRDRHGALDYITRAVERARYAPTPGEPDQLAEAYGIVRAGLMASVPYQRRMVARLTPPSILANIARVGRAIAWSLDGLEILGSRMGQRLSRTR